MIVNDVLRSKSNLELECGIGIKEYKGIHITVGPECHSPGCRGYGNTANGVMFIGIAPGKDEVKSGRPLTGPSGQVLDAVLESIGQQRTDVYCTNLICWYKDDPSPEEAERCAARLDAEIRAIKPKLIVLLGKIVVEIFTGHPFGKARGAVQWSDTYNCYLLCMNHPAAILHGMGERESEKTGSVIYDFVRDLNKIPDILRWAPGAPEAQVEYTVVHDYKEAQNVLDNLPKWPVPVALDVETDYDKDDEEVEVLKNNLLCLGVGTTEHAWVFMPSALYRENERVPALTWPDNVCWTMQNAIFDSQVVRLKLGVWLDIHEDTMLQSYTLDERSGIHGLKSQAREYLGAGFYEEERYKGKKKLKELTEEELTLYNARDVVYCARLCVKYRARQEADGVRGFYDRLLIPALNMYKEIQFEGAQIDRALHVALGEQWITMCLDQEQHLQDIAQQYGWQNGDINFNSTQQLGKFLFGTLGLPVIKMTKSGINPSTAKDVLEELRGQHEFVEYLLQYRYTFHMVNQFIISLFKQLDYDYKAHAVVKVHGTKTGRPAYTKPPLQTIPVPFTDEEYKKQFIVLRRLITATEADDTEPYEILEADLGKAEIWMAYAYSKDPQMYKDLTSGDYHTSVSMDIFEKTREEVTKEDRVKAKRITFGIMYDREAPSLSVAIKSSIFTAQEYINRFFGRNKVYAKWFRDTQEEIKKKGYLVSKTGRKRRIIIVGSAVRAVKQAVNFPIQSTTSDVVLAAAIELHKRLKKLSAETGTKIRILFTVHDSILVRAPVSRREEVARIMHDCMTTVYFEGIPPIPVEIKVGPSWGDTHEIHDCARQNNELLGGMCLW